LKRLKKRTPCRSCITRQAWRDGKFDNRKHPKELHHAWTTEHRKRVEELAGIIPPRMIAETLTKEFYIPRTVHGVRNRMAMWGISTLTTHMTMKRVSEILHVSHHRVGSWLALGLIDAIQVNNIRGSDWCISSTSLDDFLRRYPYVVTQWQRMAPGRWRNLIEMEYRRDPWLTITQIAAQLNISVRQVMRYVDRGYFPITPAKDDPINAGTRRNQSLYIRRSALYEYFKLLDGESDVKDTRAS
jgi:hypothetical protein